MIIRMLKWPIAFALSLEARLVLARYHPFIIAITGSVGKTSTKDAIAAVLEASAPLRKSTKSFNSELGIPLTILGLDTGWRNPLYWIINIFRGLLLVLGTGGSNYPKILVLEVGADTPGDIRRITKWLKPDIAVVTRLPDYPVHVEHFESPDEVRKEKAELVRALKPGGVFVANADDPAVLKLAALTTAKLMTYGFTQGAMIGGGEFTINYKREGDSDIPTGQSFVIREGETGYRISVSGTVGIHIAYAALAGAAVGRVRGVSLFHVVDAMKNFIPPKGRMRILEGVSGSVVIDDSYNSSPVAAEAALTLLREISGKRKIALLGDMLELGKWSDELHWKIGRQAGGFVDKLATVGFRARIIGEGAKTAGLLEGNIRQFSTSDEAGEWLSHQLVAGDVVLVKGSQGSGANEIRMERATRRLLLHPETAEQELVRQEKEWKKL